MFLDVIKDLNHEPIVQAKFPKPLGFTLDFKGI